MEDDSKTAGSTGEALEFRSLTATVGEATGSDQIPTLTFADLQRALTELPPVPKEYLIEVRGRCWKIAADAPIENYPLGSALVSCELAAVLKSKLGVGEPLLWGTACFVLPEDERLRLLGELARVALRRLPPLAFPSMRDPWLMDPDRTVGAAAKDPA